MPSTPDVVRGAARGDRAALPRATAAVFRARSGAGTALLLLGALGAAGGLGGCAALRSEEQKSAAATAEVLELQIDAPPDIRRVLATDLDLARLPALAGGKPLPPRELERLVAAAPQQVRALVETEGYFSANVSVEMLPGSPPTVRVAVQPGPRTHVRDVRIDVSGPLAGATQRNEPAARDAQQALRLNWPLPPGEPFRNPLWSSAKTASLTRLRAQGYIAADWLSTEARVDAQAAQVDLALVVDSGPLYRTGALRVQGLVVHDEATVRHLANFGPGTPATEKLLLDYQERLQKSGLFDRATVQLDAQTQQPDAAAVVVELAERPLQEATVGLGISSEVGPRGTLEHVHRRFLGRAATARNRFELSRVRQAWDGEISSHPLAGLHRNLVGGAVERIESDTDVVRSARLRAGRARETRVERLWFVEGEWSSRKSALRTERADAITLNYHGTWRKVDSLLLPTEGRIWALQAAAGQGVSDPGGSGPLARLYGRGNGYWPLGAWYGQARIELGQVFTRDAVVAPESMRFRAGGDNSVRGYGYRALTPVVNGVETGGKVLATASVEIARPFLERLPQLWGAVFVDTGGAAQRWSELDTVVGYGVGLRFRSPIGPLSLDVAYGEAVKKVRLHLSVGVTF